jgi:predicted RNase H-like nuclease (RuvC/YqgF family)
MNRLRMLQIAAVSVVLGSSTVLAQEPSPAERLEAGHKAFKAGEYGKALASYEQAFAADSTSINAARVALASIWAEPLSQATGKVNTWLLKKQTDATKAGDKEPSWSMAKDIVSSVKKKAQDNEAQIETLKKRIVEVDVRVSALQRENEAGAAELRSARARAAVAEERIKGLDKALRDKDIIIRDFVRDRGKDRK